MGKRESTGGSSGVQQLLRDAIQKSKKNLARASKAPARVSREGTASALTGARTIRESQSFRPLETIQTPAGEGPRIKIVLIDEGLGNRRNMNYYGPEAIASAAKVFEGKPSFANHPSESEETDLPERSVLKQYGYFKGLHVEKLKNAEGKEVSACVGELHFDLSELGREMYAKALTAIHYQKEFPDSTQQYMGWSVLGGGDGEKREMDPAEDNTGTLKEFDEPVEVNYVTEFVEGESCDAVTRAGRGGRVLAVAENDQGAQEDGMKKLLESAKALLKTVQESAKKAEGDAKKALLASAKTIEAQVTVLEDDMAAEGGDPFEQMCAKREGEDDASHAARLHAMAKHLAGKLAPAEGDADGDDDKDPDPKAEESADTREAKKVAVEAYMEKAGLPKDAYSESEIARLAGLTFKEAKAAIDKDAKFAESIRKEADLPVASLRGAARESLSGTGRGNKALKESFSQED